jgi:hypothetical protein
MQFTLEEAECCNHTMPTPVCPFCLNCFCTAPEAQRQQIRQTLDSLSGPTETSKKAIFSKPIGSILLECGLISRESLNLALAKQNETGAPLGQILVDMNLVSSDVMRNTLLNQTWIEPIELDNISLDLRLIKRFGLEFCSRHQILPIELLLVKDHAILRVAISKRDTLEAIRIHPAFQTFGILPYFAPPDQISDLLGQIGPAKV